MRERREAEQNIFIFDSTAVSGEWIYSFNMLYMNIIILSCINLDVCVGWSAMHWAPRDVAIGWQRIFSFLLLCEDKKRERAKEWMNARRWSSMDVWELSGCYRASLPWVFDTLQKDDCVANVRASSRWNLLVDFNFGHAMVGHLFIFRHCAVN